MQFLSKLQRKKPNKTYLFLLADSANLNNIETDADFCKVWNLFDGSWHRVIRGKEVLVQLFDAILCAYCKNTTRNNSKTKKHFLSFCFLVCVCVCVFCVCYYFFLINFSFSFRVCQITHADNEVSVFHWNFFLLTDFFSICRFKNRIFYRFMIKQYAVK